MDQAGREKINKALELADIAAVVQTRPGEGEDVPYVTITTHPPSREFQPGAILNVLDSMGVGERRETSPLEIGDNRTMELVVKMQGADNITFIDRMTP